MHTCDSWTRFVYILKLYHQFTLELDDIHDPFNSARDQTAATPLPGKLQRDLLDIPSPQGQDVMSSTSMHTPDQHKTTFIDKCWFSHWE